MTTRPIPRTEWAAAVCLVVFGCMKAAPQATTETTPTPRTQGASGVSEAVREDVVRLRELVRDMPEASGGIGDETPEGSRELLDRLATSGPDVVPELVEVMLDEDLGFGRDYVAALLGKVPNRRAVPGLIQALEDDSWALRVAACHALAKIGDRRAVAPLILRLRDVCVEVRSDSAYALGIIGDRRAAPALLALLGDTKWRDYEGRQPLEALSKIAGTDFGEDQAACVAWWREQGVTPDTASRGSELPPPPSVEEAARILRRSRSFHTRAGACQVLGQHGGGAAIAALVASLGDASISGNAGCALEAIGRPAVPALLDCVRSGEEGCERAVVTLAGIPDPRTKAVVLEALRQWPVTHRNIGSFAYFFMRLTGETFEPLPTDGALGADWEEVPGKAGWRRYTQESLLRQRGAMLEYMEAHPDAGQEDGF